MNKKKKREMEESNFIPDQDDAIHVDDILWILM